MTVDSVVAVEPEPYLQERAADAAARARIPIQVTDGRAERIPVDDDSADAVVLSGVLCSVTDPDASLAEIRRVLRPQGRLRFYEHVRSRALLFARLQDAPISPGRTSWAAAIRTGTPERDQECGIRHRYVSWLDLPAQCSRLTCLAPAFSALRRSRP